MNKFSVTLTKTGLTLGIGYFLLQLLVIPQILLWGNYLLGSPLNDAQVNFLFFAINFLVITVAFRRFLWENFKILLESPWHVLRFAFLGLLLYWIASFLIGFLIIGIAPDFVNANDQSVAAMRQENYLLISVGTVLLVPVTEEMLFRGVIFGGLYRKRPVVAYVVSTALFAAVHLLGYIKIYTPVQLLLAFLQYLPAGFCLAWAYVKSDCIWAPIFIHIAVNQIGNYAAR